MYEKRIVRQVGHLQELYRDTWSTEHKIPCCKFIPVPRYYCIYKSYASKCNIF